MLRVRDFSAVPDGHALLERLQFASPSLDVVVHVEVIGGVRAHRLSARAVHRVGSDDATSQAAGFRRTAQSSRALERLRQRESLVVEGAALMRVAVFVVIRAASLRQLRRDASVGHAFGHRVRIALRSGLRSTGRVVLRPTAGCSGVVSRSWTHWATSRDLSALMVPAHDAGTGLAGPSPGRDASAAARSSSIPSTRTSSGLVSNPNVIVAGSIGAGKSTVVKMMLDRALERGRRAVIIDPKGEYAALARSYDVNVVALGRDGWCSPFPSNDRESRDLLRALIASAQGAALKSDQHYVIDEVWQGLDSPRPARVLRALFESLQSHLASTAETPERSLALTLYRFIHGDLAGLFDGDDEPMVFAGQLVVLDLSAQWSSNSLFGGRAERGGGRATSGGSGERARLSRAG